MRLSFEFENVVDGRLNRIGIAAIRVVVDAVQKKHIAAVRLPVDRRKNVAADVNRSTVLVLKRIDGTGTRGEQEQFSEVASVQRQLVNLLGTDDCAEFGGGGLKIDALRGDDDLFTGRTDGHSEVDGGSLVDFELEAGLENRLKALGEDLQGVASWRHGREIVDTGAVGSGDLLEVSVVFDQVQSGAGDDCIATILDGSIERSRTLRDGRTRESDADKTPPKYSGHSVQMIATASGTRRHGILLKTASDSNHWNMAGRASALLVRPIGDQSNSG